MDVCAIGELLIDFLDKSKEKYPTLKANPGGAPCNFLATLTHFNKDASFIGKVGNDYFGNILKETLFENRIDTTNLIMSDDYFTTLAFVMLDKNNDRHFAFARKPGADATLLFEEVNLNKIDEVKMFYFGGVSLTKSPTRDTVFKVLDYAINKKKIILFDPNLRENLWSNLNEAKEYLLKAISKTSILKISIEEIEFLYGSRKEAIQAFKTNCNLKLIFITYGKDGAEVIYKDLNYKYDGEVVDVKDTTGAGDIFFGTAISELLNTNKNLDDLDNKDIESITKKAISISAKSCMHEGGISSIKELMN